METEKRTIVTPAEAGVQVWKKAWIPVFTGMTDKARPVQSAVEVETSDHNLKNIFGLGARGW
jgi:hypothetical protein